MKTGQKWDGTLLKLYSKVTELVLKGTDTGQKRNGHIAEKCVITRAWFF